MKMRRTAAFLFIFCLCNWNLNGSNARPIPRRVSGSSGHISVVIKFVNFEFRNYRIEYFTAITKYNRFFF